jgi:hypothetical protein
MNPQQAQPQPAQPGVDPTAIAQAFAQALRDNQPPPQQPQLTPEQMDQMLRTFRVGPDLVDALFGDNASPESRMAALSHLVSGVVANATAHAQVLADNYINNYHQQINPHLEDARELSQERFYTQLYEGAPGLKQYDPIVKEFLPKLQADPGYPKERAQRTQFVRDKVTGILKQTNPQFDPTVGASNNPSRGAFAPTNQSQPSATPSLPALGSGASGGTSGGQSSGAIPKMGFSLG